MVSKRQLQEVFAVHKKGRQNTGWIGSKLSESGRKVIGITEIMTPLR